MGCEGVAGTCLETVFCIVSSLFLLRLEQFPKDAFIHSLTRLRTHELFILRILFYWVSNQCILLEGKGGLKMPIPSATICQCHPLIAASREEGLVHPVIGRVEL